MKYQSRYGTARGSERVKICQAVPLMTTEHSCRELADSECSYPLATANGSVPTRAKAQNALQQIPSAEFQIGSRPATRRNHPATLARPGQNRQKLKSPRRRLSIELP